MLQAKSKNLDQHWARYKTGNNLHILRANETEELRNILIKRGDGSLKCLAYQAVRPAKYGRGNKATTKLNVD